MKSFYVIFFSRYSLRIGEYDLGLKSGLNIANIERISIHDKYERGKSYYDLAVLHTNGVNISSDLTSFLQPVCLPERSSSNRDEYARDSVQLIGK